MAVVRNKNVIQPVRVTVAELVAHLDQLCPGSAIDLAGAVALPCELPHADRWFDWIEAGRHADLEYLIRDPAGRVDPTLKNPWAKAVLIFAQRYTAGWPAHDPVPASGGPPG